MATRLIKAARVALAELCAAYRDDYFLERDARDGPKRTIIDLYDALVDVGENVSDYKEDYEMCKDDLGEDWRDGLHSGDEVTWRDPVGGARVLKIATIAIKDNVFSIETMDGDHIEGFLTELS